MSGSGFFSDTHLQDFAKSLIGKVTAFVETGACEGDTTKWASHWFPAVFTCEIDGKYLSALYWGLPSNVYLYDESSPQFLLEIQPLAGDFPLFFLDAHWFDYWPLHDELITISRLYGKAIVIVHDCVVPGRPNFWACKGGGADHDGPVCDWEYIRQSLVAGHWRLFYPTYTAETPGYCVLFKDCAPCGDLSKIKEAGE